MQINSTATLRCLKQNAKMKIFPSQNKLTKYLIRCHLSTYKKNIKPYVR
jgi:hypothetical protein